MDTTSTHIGASRTPAPAPAAAPGEPARPKRAGSSYAPIDYYLDAGNGTAGRGWTTGRLGFKLRRDPELLLAVAIAVPVLAVEGSAHLELPWLVVAVPAAFLVLQLLLSTWRSAPAWLPAGRLAISLAFLVVANQWLDPSDAWPLGSLFIPVIALAASRGDRMSVTVAIAGMCLLLVPLALETDNPSARQQTLARAMAAGVVAIGCRRVVDSLERSSLRLRQANARDRRHARQLAAVESVGRVLAREGPTPQAFDKVIGVLEETFGYQYPSIYTWDGQALQLGAQRNYRYPIQTITPDRGIIGRIVRTREPAFLPDARRDPDFLSADPDVVSEIGIPLLADDQLLGILNVETSGRRRLDENDFSTMEIVGDRLAAALALGRERQKLTERAALLDRLTVFATVLSSSLDPATMDDEVVAGAATVIPADRVLLFSRDEATGSYEVAAITGGDPEVVGRAIKPGEGASGRAIATRTVIVDDRLERARFPALAAGVTLPDVLAGMSAPMLLGDEVVGVVTWLRSDLASPFTAQEQEVAALLAGKVGLALSNARLHQRARDAAITDPLTGIHNRRHFDAALDLEDAVRRRTPAEDRRPRSAILFDLDHFGKVNKLHGHRVGDRVLRLFADTLRSRARASDIVARYGGEEFVVILDNATREHAVSIAEAVRTAFSKQSVEAGGDLLSSTVSAGCSTLEPWEVEGALLLERADVALAMAKAGGRDQVVAA